MQVTKQFADIDKSPKAPLIERDRLASVVAILREQLELDRSPEVVAALREREVKRALLLPWWQRLPIPGTPVFSTSDHSLLEVSHPGWLNTLGDALTPEEGFILRPMPKWAYIEPLLPDLSAKSVLDLGCSNGFFAFKFAELEAKEVTGVEIAPRLVRAARWLLKRRGLTNLHFELTDALLDFSLPQHDVVFMSEVHGHFIDPLYGILRAVNLTKETLIIDGAALPDESPVLDVGLGLDPVTRRPAYHSWIMSDGLMLTYLMLCGVPPQRITRYFAPWPNHILYKIDTRGVAHYRDQNRFHVANASFLEMNFKIACPKRRRRQWKHLFGISRA